MEDLCASDHGKTYTRVGQLWDMACEVRYSLESSFEGICESYGISKEDKQKFISDFYVSAILNQCGKDENSCENCPFYVSKIYGFPSFYDHCRIHWLTENVESKMNEIVKARKREKNSEESVVVK